MVKYIPQKGDIIETDFNPTKGHEQGGHRPALIVSNETYYRRTKLIIICPISNTLNEFPMHIKLDDRTKTTGSILSQHVRTIDPESRKISFIETMPPELTEQAIKNIGLCFI